VHPRRHQVAKSERGSTLIELMVALVVLSIGLLAVAQLFPAGARSQVQDRMITVANYYAQEKIERLTSLDWSHPELAVGRHPITGAEALGANGAWSRIYDVAVMAAPLDNLKKVNVTVWWKNGRDSVETTTYVKR
jgi:prepilin-type N-terminal cleavage/methylation domain-containing protein